MLDLEKLQISGSISGGNELLLPMIFKLFFSTIATLLAIVCIPMLYNYMQTVQIRLEDEIGFCRSQTKLLDDRLFESVPDEVYERYER